MRAGTALQERDDLAGRVLLVRFEDVKRDPVAAIARLWDFAGLEHGPGDTEDAARATSFEALRQRVPTGDGQFRRKGEVGDWVVGLTDEDVALFRELAGDAFAEAGYSF